MSKRIMCHSCGEIFPMDWEGQHRWEDNGQVSSYHMYCPPPTEKCSRCGMFRKVCESCGEVAVRKSVEWFAIEMEKTLRQHDHKGGWDRCTLDYLMGRLYEEYIELDFSLSTDGVPDEDIIRECTDIANFAMMLADRVRKGAMRREPKKVSESD